MAQSALQSLDGMLVEAEKLPNSADFINARLFEDMNSLTFQVHYATFQAQKLAASLSGREYPETKDDLDSYTRMHAVIHEALEALSTLTRATVDNVEEMTTTITTHSEAAKQVPVRAVVGLVNMPNVYFHVCMAYAILRKEGVPLKKRHWSRAFVSAYM